MKTVFAAALALGLVSTAYAEDKKDAPKLAGTWVREADGIELAFQFVGDDVVKVSVTAGDNGIVSTCKYTVGKDGVISAKITDVKEKGTFPSKPPVGLEFKCKFTIAGKTAKLTDFESEKAEGAKDVLEGEYKAKKAD